MAFKDVTNPAYLALIAMAESKQIRKAHIQGMPVYFVANDHAEALKKLGIEPVLVGEAVVQQLQREGIYDYSAYPLSFTNAQVRNAIEDAQPRSRSNYLLAPSIDVNAESLPYTEATQQEVDSRKMMLR